MSTSAGPAGLSKKEIALLIVALASGACSKSRVPQSDSGIDSGLPSKLGFSKCIEDWPTAGGAHPTKLSLAVDAPKLAWRLDLQTNSSSSFGLSDGGPVLSKNRVVVQAGELIYFLNKDGTKSEQVKYNAIAAYPSGLAADLDGNIYYVCDDGVYSVDANGGLRWNRAFATHPGAEFSYYHPAVLGPDDVLYAVTSTDQVCALRTKDGGIIWCQSPPSDTRVTSQVLGGAGKGLFVLVGDQRIDVLDTRTGESIGTLVVSIDGKIVAFTAQWGGWALGWTFGIAIGDAFVLDTCGNLRWSNWSKDPSTSGGAGIIAAGELLTAATSTRIGSAWVTTSGRLLNADGSVAASTTQFEGQAIAAGADGTIYTYRCEDATPAVNRILAYSPDLKELWRFDLGGEYCRTIIGNVLLDDDGMMYMKRQNDSYSTEVIAIQTRSPGLADSSWPSWRHDNRGTAWLVPVAAGFTTSEDADVSGAADAPVESVDSD